MSRLPLDGILVVSVEQAVAAPLCTARLAADGARVIKVERPEGDFAREYDRMAEGQSSYFVWLNHGKESIALDLKSPDDLALLKRMISRADVFVQNLAPGACARLGLDSDTLSSLSPALITCDISGYGEEGPYRDMKAYDLLVQCEAGLASITGTPDAPGRVGVSISDIGCGMNAYAGILRALLFRGATGRGSNVAVALFDTVAEWMCVPYLHARAGAPPQRVGIAHPSIAPYGQFRTAEGSVIVIAVQNDREWSRLSRAVLQRDDLACNPAFANNHARVANRQELDALIADVMATLSIEVAAERLRTADIAFGFVNDVLGLARHPHLRLLPVANLGSVDVIAPAVRVRGERSAAGRVPQLNEHGAEIRREFG